MTGRNAILALVAALTVTGVAAEPPPTGGPATWFNDGRTVGADPFVRFDRASGYYFAYSTDGADTGFHFAVYRSPDLATWQRLPGGALPADDPKQWAHDWFWAPEVYHNEKTGVYFLFYAGRMNTQVARHFHHANFEEACKVGVAVSRTPQGPFHNIAAEPIDYFPFDPAYHDVNLLMDAAQKKPPATKEEGERAPLGTYLPFIDPNVFFDDTGRIFLYFSRNAYRNWVWDEVLGRYIEESNIYAVELDSAWWRDPRGATLPRIAPTALNPNRSPKDPADVRKDGFTPIISYGADPQAWENAHVGDYDRTGGRKKNRRWAEGSTTLKVYRPGGQPVYVLLYSANNFENEHYGVGYALADAPLGPWRKSPANPVLSPAPEQSLYSTGHGSVTESPDGRERFYVFHGRRSTRDNRRLYTQRLHITLEPSPAVSIAAPNGDQPFPSGVVPLRIHATEPELRARPGEPAVATIMVTSATGAGFDLTHPLNRLRAELLPASAGTVAVTGPRVTVTLPGASPARLRIFYQRERADHRYVDTVGADGTPVQLEIPIVSGR